MKIYLVITYKGNTNREFIEHGCVTNSLSKAMLSDSTFIFDFVNMTVIKCRYSFDEQKKQDALVHYLNKYAGDIDKFMAMNTK